MNRNKIHKLILLSFSLLLIIFSCKNQVTTVEPSAKIEFSVLAWNIWHGAKNPALNEDGRPHVIGIIKALNPDIVLMVETYGSGKMIADALGYHFHLIAPENTAPDDGRINLSIISRFPFGKRFDFYNHFNIGGIEIFLNDTAKIHAFSIWLNYQPWEDDPLTLNKSPEELIEWEKSGSRPAELDAILRGLQPYLDLSDEIPLILGGDFNIWSHLDWQEDTKSLHKNRVVNWWTTSTLEKAGLIDSYREVNPNAFTHPGITWDLPGIKDEHRIDYIFYKSPKIKAVNSETYMVPFNDTLTINGRSFMYPSDHGFVFTTFKWN
jgi:endonuclease/exonuclease/phosphatase (EEP) superfamily protein YafD